MRTFFVSVFTLLSFIFLSGLLPAQAEAKANLVFIFDASGSMWGQIDGKPKIAIAKEAMDLIVGDLPADMNVGLVAYGHRRKGDCDDVETLIPLGPLDAKAFLKKVNALNPKGKTPMVRSIRMTAEAIKHLEDETTILLVSDGEETCDPDPCGFVAELEKLGIKFVLHVVGFDVGGKTEEQLKCMAQGGRRGVFPGQGRGKTQGRPERRHQKDRGEKSQGIHFPQWRAHWRVRGCDRSGHRGKRGKPFPPPHQVRSSWAWPPARIR